VPDGIGWIATPIFGVSYLVRRPAAMRLVQAAASLCWIVYGVLLHAPPVIVANVIVTSLAVFSAWRIMQAPNPAVPSR
jgi:Bacterial inner membrane protein